MEPTFRSETWYIKSAPNTTYATVTYKKEDDTEQVWSVFAQVGKHGSEEGINVSALCRVVSKAIHRGVDVWLMVETLQGLNAGWMLVKRYTNGRERIIKSLPDFIAFVLQDAQERIGKVNPNGLLQAPNVKQ